MYATLNDTDKSVITGKDNVVIRKMTHDIKGGKTLDVTGFTPAIIQAGHPIIRETATGNYKPMPIASASAYAALPTGHTYAGILSATIETKRPFASILIGGEVNPVAAPYDLPTVQAAIKTAIPTIIFQAD